MYMASHSYMHAQLRDVESGSVEHSLATEELGCTMSLVFFFLQPSTVWEQKRHFHKALDFPKEPAYSAETFCD